MRSGPRQPGGRSTEKLRRSHGSRSRGAADAGPRDVTLFLRDLVTDPEVQGAVRDHVISGKDGAVQLFLEAVAYVVGRPRATVRLDVTPDLARLLAMVDPSGIKEKPAGQAADGDPVSPLQ